MNNIIMLLPLLIEMGKKLIPEITKMISESDVSFTSPEKTIRIEINVNMGECKKTSWTNDGRESTK